MPAKPSLSSAPRHSTAHKTPQAAKPRPRPGPRPLSHASPPTPSSPSGGRLKPSTNSPQRSRSQETSSRQRYPEQSSVRHSFYDRPKREDTRWRSVSPRRRSSPLGQPPIGLRRRLTRDSDFSADEDKPSPRRPSPDSSHRPRQRQPPAPRPQPPQPPQPAAGARPVVGRHPTDSYRPSNRRRPSYETPRTPRYPPGFRPARPQADSPQRTPTTPRSRSKERHRRRETDSSRDQGRHMPDRRTSRHRDKPARPERQERPDKAAEKPSRKASPAKGFEIFEKLPAAFGAYLGLKSLGDYADKAKEWTDWLGDIKEAPEEMNALSAKTTTARDTITQIQNAIEARPDLLEGESGAALKEQVETAMEDARAALKRLTKMLQDLDNVGNKGAAMNEIEEFYHSYRYKDEWEEKIKEADAELEKQLGTLSMLMVNIYSRSLMKSAPPGLNNPIPSPVPGSRPSDTDTGRRPAPVKLDPPPVGRHSVPSTRSEEEKKTEEQSKPKEADSKNKDSGEGEKVDADEDDGEPVNIKSQQTTPRPEETKAEAKGAATEESKDNKERKQPERPSTPEDPREVLLDAAWNGDLEACANALRSASPNTRDPRGLTPLHLASERDHLAIAMLLIDHSSDPNAHSLSGRTPLHLACRYASSAMVEFLLNDACADPNARDANGRTSFHYAALAGNDDERREVVRMLRDAKADPTLEDDRGRTARELAQKRDFWDVAATLRRAEKRWEEEHRENWLQRHRFMK